MMREPHAEQIFGAGQPPRKIAVFRALQLGDMLCAVPALRALRAAAPLSQITLIGLPWAATFVKRFGRYLDDLLVFPGFPAFPEQPAHLNAVPHFLAEAQRLRLDLAMCGKTDLGAMGALLAQARLVVTNDTGISHMAAAVATPSVVVSCSADPARWAPLDSERHLVISADVSCRPCTHLECPTAHECATDVGADVVAVMAARVIRNWEKLPLGEEE